MTMCSRNKDAHPAIAAGATPKPCAPRGSVQQMKLQKAASKAAQQATLEKKEELNTQHIATIEEESTAAYTDMVTLCPPPALKSKPEICKGDNRAQGPPL
jgi:Na+-translocating ferredoxin:NAD+ oxidoreductase RNF subunit RnfB